MDDLKIFLITVVPMADDAMRFDRLNYWMQNTSVIEGYWNYIPAVYAVKSRLTAVDLRKNLFSVLAGNFMVSEININNLDGSLPLEAWQWFYEPPTPRPMGLSGVNLTTQSLASLGKLGS